MIPILFHLGSIPVHTYGVLTAIGFIAALFVIQKFSKRSGLPVEPMLDLTFFGLLAALIGARLLFVFTRLESYLQDPLSMIRIWEGGFVFFGGMIFGLIFGIWFTKKKNLNPWKVVDVIVMGAAIGHAFGRFGCFTAGCCYGRPTESFLGIAMKSELIAPELRMIPLHPVQLYEAFSLFVLFFGLTFVFKRKKFDGQVGLVYFISYPVLRILMELFRGDEIRGFVIGHTISTSQFISALVFFAAIAVLIWKTKKVQTS